MKTWIPLSVLILGLAAMAVYYRTLNQVPHPERAPILRWQYQLQGYSKDFVEKNSRQRGTLFVMDYSKDGSDGAAFSREEIEKLKNGGANTVVSYMSIGESEEARWYFPDIAPELKSNPNPDWPDNYRVPYWDPRWQEIIATGSGSYLRKILAAGFDGVYLDIVDGYENFPKRPTAAADMMAWVEKISSIAKAERPDFLIIPQNAPCIPDRDGFTQLSDAQYREAVEAYFSAIDGIALEDTFFHGDAEMDNPYAPQIEVLRCLERFTQHGKFKVGVDYLRDPQKQAKALSDFKSNGILGLVTDRGLKGKFFKYPAE